MAKKRKTKKWTRAEVKKQTKKILALVEEQRRENQYEHFAGITAAELAPKFERINSPMFMVHGWNTPTPGGTLNATATVYNPDPTTAGSLVLHVWVGSGHADPNLGTFLSNVDERFPRLGAGAPFGFSLAAGASQSFSFALPIPANIDRSSYVLNFCLFRLTPFSQGTFLDRSGIAFAVV